MLVMSAPSLRAHTIPPEAWIEDLDTLAEQLLKVHPDFFTVHSVEEFETALSELAERSTELDDVQMTMGISRLVAMGGDAHTNSGFGFAENQMRRMPIQAAVLADGVFINAALKPYQELIGAEIISINGVAADEAIERVSALFAYENRSKQISTGAGYITLLPALAEVGILEDHASDTVTITIAQNDTQREQAFDCSLPDPNAKTRPQWVNFVQQLEQPWPRAYRMSRGYYQSDFIADHQTMYIAYNKCRDAEDLPFNEFVDFVMSKSEELDAKRIIIDFRFNGGGDETVIRPLFHELQKSDRFRDKGDIIGLTSRRTFSSAMSNTHQLRDWCNGLLIGEPTGGKPNHYGQIRSFELPNSKIKVWHSTRWFQKVEGNPDAVHPDVLIEVDSEALFSGHDPVLDSALEYESD
jgi:hypothetical protein